MVERSHASSDGAVHPLIEKARTSTVPIAALIGFHVEDIGGGRAVASHQFLPPVWQTLLRAEARVVNRGRNVGYVECDVVDQDGRQIAKATSTCFVLRGEHARAR